MDHKLYSLAEQCGQLLLSRKLLCATAESCTGGGVAQAITRVPGSSDWFERGFVTYSNVAKQEMLGVSLDVLMQFGAVSEETARAMAEGALNHSHAQVSVAVTGIAGPSGGCVDKPVGLVWFAWAQSGQLTQVQQQFFSGSRQAIQAAAVEFALRQWLKVII